jgi:hypothetical protein
VAGSSDPALRRTSDVATAHSRDARTRSFLSEIFDLGRRSRKTGAAVMEKEENTALLLVGVID